MKKLLALTVLFAASVAQAQTLATVTPSTTPAIAVPRNFLGLSTSYCSGATFLGQAGTPFSPVCGPTTAGTDTIARQLISNVMAPGGGFHLRVSGADASNLVQNVEPYIELATAEGNTTSLGVNLQTATLAQTEAQCAAYYAAMPSAVIEQGNEPDLYGITSSTYYALIAQRLAGCQGVTSAATRYEFPSFSWWAATSSTMLNTQVPGVMTTNKGFAGYFSLHYYPFSSSTCTSDSTVGAPSPDCLLKTAYYTVSQNFRSWAIVAHSLGIAFRLGESNTISGGGLSATSNGFSSGIWGVVTFFQAALAGIDGVDVHCNCYAGAGTYYDPWYVTYTAGSPNTYSLASNSVMPIYFAQLFFAQNTPVVSGKQAEIVPVSIANGTSSSILGWGTVDGANNYRLILVSADRTNSGNVLVSMPNCTSATASYLTASNYYATSGLTINGNGSVGSGQSFDSSTTGAIVGSAAPLSLTPSSGVFTIPLAVTQVVSVAPSPAGCLVSHS